MYYVYVYLDPRKPGRYCYDDLEVCFLYEPFYVGKGKGARYKSHLDPFNLKSRFNTHKTGKIKRILNEGHDLLKFIDIPFNSLSEDDALELEKKVIQTIGRSDLNEGPLTNQCDGGVGSFDIGKHNVSSRKGHLKQKYVMSEDQKKHLSAIRSMPIKQIDKKTLEVVKIWPNAKVAAATLGICEGSIYATVSETEPAKSGGGWYWEYVDKPNKKYIGGVKYYICKGSTHPKSKKYTLTNVITGEIREIISLHQFCVDNDISHNILRYSAKTRRPQQGWIIAG